MKIIHTMYSGLGGHSSVVFSLIKGDIKKVAEHSILFYGIEDLLPEYELACKQLNLSYKFVKKRKGVDLTSWYKCLLFFSTIKPNVIVINSTNLVLPGFVYRIFKKVQLLVVEHTSNHIKTKVDQLRSFLSFLIIKKVICLSPLYKDQLQNQFGKFVTNSRLFIIPNGIDTSFYVHKAKERSKIIRIGIHVRLSTSKDINTIFRALSRLNTIENTNYMFYIAGDGTQRHSLKQLSLQLQIDDNVSFLGILDEEAVVVFLQGLDIYVMSSHADTMSTSVMQAMSCGLPIIASNISGINNLIMHKESGLLFTSKNEKQLVSHLLHLINNEKEGKRLGRNARFFAEKELSHIQMFNSYYDLITKH